MRKEVGQHVQGPTFFLFSFDGPPLSEFAYLPGQFLEVARVKPFAARSNNE
jgi:hypothetical protein